MASAPPMLPLDIDQLRDELVSVAAGAGAAPMEGIAGVPPTALGALTSLPLDELAFPTAGQTFPGLASPTITPSSLMRQFPASFDLPLDLMDTILPMSSDAPSSPGSSDDSGHASDASAGGYSMDSPPAYDADAEAALALELPAPAHSEPRPFAKQRPFGKKAGGSFLDDLTAQERDLLEAEGLDIPLDGTTLTKAEERQVKKIRRKIKNKISARESRDKRKMYVAGLEKRVAQETKSNVRLRGRITTLEEENATLLDQLKRLQETVQRMAKSSGASAGTTLMLLGLCFSIYLSPAVGGAAKAGTVAGPTSGFAPQGFSSRTLKSLPSGPEVEASRALLSSLFASGPPDAALRDAVAPAGATTSTDKSMGTAPVAAHSPVAAHPPTGITILPDEAEAEDGEGSTGGVEMTDRERRATLRSKRKADDSEPRRMGGGRGSRSMGADKRGRVAATTAAT